MIPCGHLLTGSELLAFQKKAFRHIAFSLTEACPLRCAHCIVSSQSSRKQKKVTITPEQALGYADQMSALQKKGVQRVSFTGGEPLLAKAQLRTLSEAVAVSGMTSTVITACHWAGDDLSARKTVRSFPHISHWHLSTDRFHTVFVPLEFLLRAVKAVLEAGRQVLIRLTVTAPRQAADQQIYNQLRARLPKGVPVAVQPVSPVGRAERLGLRTPVGQPRQAPCLSTGLVVRWDGTVSPCCASLVGQRGGHPFQYDSALEVGLVRIYRQWQADPLLRLIRAVGFTPAFPWIQEEIPEHPVLGAIPNHPCDVCVALWKHPGTADFLWQTTRRPEVVNKIDKLYKAVFKPSSIHRKSREGKLSFYSQSL